MMSRAAKCASIRSCISLTAAIWASLAQRGARYAELLAQLALVHARAGGQSPLDDHVAHPAHDLVMQARPGDRRDRGNRVGHALAHCVSRGIQSDTSGMNE